MIYDRVNFKRSLSLKYSELDVAHLVVNICNIIQYNIIHTNFLTAQLFVHSPEQVPFVNMELINLQDKGIRYEYAFSVLYIYFFSKTLPFYV